jgi:hypothetical protein
MAVVGELLLTKAETCDLSIAPRAAHLHGASKNFEIACAPDLNLRGAARDTREGELCDHGCARPPSANPEHIRAPEIGR